MLRVLPPTFKPVSRQIRFHSRVVKRATLRSFPTRFAAMWQNKLHVFCYLSYLTSGGVRTSIAKHHGRYSKSDHLRQDGVE